MPSTILPFEMMRSNGPAAGEGGGAVVETECVQATMRVATKKLSRRTERIRDSDACDYALPETAR